MERDLFFLLVWIWIGIGLLTGLLLLWFRIRAPYGRHTRPGWGPMIDNKWGWFWMEMPALIVMPVLALLGPNPQTPYLLLLTGLWLFHYLYRTLIFPFRLKTKNKKMPLTILLSAQFFNVINGLINGYYLGFLSSENAAVFEQPNTWLGLLLFFGGTYLNRSADRRLIALRENGQGYRIPSGWWFEYISCPNHFGEIIEWIGFAIIAWNLPATSFAIWTFCNLAPRAQDHHRWYREEFTEYPERRKALLPFIW